MPKDPTKRFTDRVENYVKYRPSYPKKLITVLKDKRIISDNSIIADIGSGTGIFTRILLDTGCKVFAVEPNDKMRNKAEASLLHFSNFISINGQAEQTTLDSNSIDVLTVAQAFHWFDLEKTRKEFLWILKPEGYLVLIWNERLIDEVLFQKEYDSLLRQYCPEYVKVSYHKVTDEQINRFYGSSQIEIFTCENYQYFDFQGLQGRVESSSYSPQKGSSNYQLLITALKDLYNKFQVNNQVKFEYKTQMYYGRIFNDAKK